MQPSLFARVKKLTESEPYRHQKISQEGYGTFISSSSHDELWMQAEKLKAKADLLSGADSVLQHIAVLGLYMDAISKMGPTEELLMLRLTHISKFLDGVISHARRNRLDEHKKVLKWALFNIKLNLLFKQSGKLGNEEPTEGLNYLCSEIKLLEFLYNSRDIQLYEIIPLEMLMNGITTKLKEINTKLKEMNRNNEKINEE